MILSGDEIGLYLKAVEYVASLPIGARFVSVDELEFDFNDTQTEK